MAYDKFAAVDSSTLLFPPTVRANLAAVSPNTLLNGAMEITQRNTTHVNAPSGQYFTDRWYGKRTSGTGNIDFSRQSSSLASIPYCVRYQRTSGTTSTDPFEFMQTLETSNSVPLQNKTVTFSFYARAGANFSAASSNITYGIYSGTGTDQNLGSGFTGQSTVATSTVAITTSWQRFTVSGTLGSSITEVGVKVFWTPVGTAGAADYVELTGLQLEEGAVATPFRRNANSIQGELAACQRYYQRFSTAGALAPGNYYNTTQIMAYVSFQTKMRTAVSTTFDSSTLVARHFSGGTIGLTSPVIEANDNGVLLFATVASGTRTANDAMTLYIGSGGYLGFSAEL